MKLCADCGAEMQRSNFGFRYECVKSHAGIPTVIDPEARVSFWALIAMVALAVGLLAVLWFGTQRPSSSVEISLTGGTVVPKH